MQPRVLAAGLCALALSAGCNGDAPEGSGVAQSPRVTETSSAGPTASPDSSPTVASGCPNEPQRLRSRRLTGDLDGNGSAEKVGLAVDQSAPPGCQVFVVVRSPSLDDVAAVKDPNISFDIGLPALDSTKSIGFGPGEEVVMVLSAGASTQFFGLASVIDGDLVQITIEDGPYGNLFPYGGSVGHLEASDCASPTVGETVPTIVISSATSEGNRYRVERRFFEISEGPEIVPQPDLTERKVVAFEELVSYPEFGESPFAHCR